MRHFFEVLETSQNRSKITPSMNNFNVCARDALGTTLTKRVCPWTRCVHIAVWVKSVCFYFNFSMKEFLPADFPQGPHDFGSRQHQLQLNHLNNNIELDNPTFTCSATHTPPPLSQLVWPNYWVHARFATSQQRLNFHLAKTLTKRHS